MSEGAKDKRQRQGKKIAKTDFHFRIHNECYDWLCFVALRKNVSVAKLLNAILHNKPEANDFYIR